MMLQSHQVASKYCRANISSSYPANLSIRAFVSTLKTFFGRRGDTNDTFAEEFSENLRKDKARILGFSESTARSKFVRLYSDEARELKDGSIDEEKAFRKAFNTNLSAALTLPTRKSSNHASTKVKEASTQHPLWDDTQGIVRLCLSLSKRFQEACATIAQAKPTEELGETWSADHTRLADELQMGYRVAERQIARVVGRKGEGSLDAVAPIEAAKEDRRMAQVLAMKVPGPSMGVAGEISLSDTLRCAQSGVRKFVKGLPVTEALEE